MINKVKPFVVVILALSGFALLGYSQAWAQPPRAQQIIFGEYNDIKVQFDQKGELLAVYFLEEDCEPTLADDCWRESTAHSGVICTCVGSNCSEDLETNIANQGDPNVTLDCHEMTNSGPRSTGCPLYGSRSFTYGGLVYSR